MPESKAEQRTADRARGVGKFNQGGKVVASKDCEFYQKGGKWFVRNRPQTTKDNNQMAKEGKDSKSTKRENVEKEAKITAKAEAKTRQDLELAGTGGKDVTLAEGDYGKLDGQYTVGKVEANASAEASVSKDGVEVKAGAGAKVTLVGGKLVYTYPFKPMTLAGQKLQIIVGAEVSAEVAAEAKGEVGIAAKKSGDKIDIGSSAGGEAFAGAKAGFKIFGQLKWEDPTSKKYDDVIQVFAGAEAWAGAAAAAKVMVGLSPKIKANAYFGAAVGVGASVKAGVEIHAINGAKLAFILLTSGIKAAWEGLSSLAVNIWDWLITSAAEIVDDASVLIAAVWEGIKSDYKKVVQLWKTLGDKASALWAYVKKESWAYIGKLMAAFGGKCDELWDWVWDACKMEDLPELFANIGGLFNDFLAWLWSGSGADASCKQIGRMLSAASGTVFKKFMAWLWPELSMEKLAQIAAGVGGMLSQYLAYIWDVCDFDQMVRFVKEIACSCASLLDDVVSWIWSNVDDAASMLWKAL